MCYYFVMIELKDIQKRLREEIRNSNLSQKELAEKVGINPSTISKYLRQDKFPAIDTFANICEVLDVSADEILGLKK
ncbi:MAG: helix-turn-helix transcriptional regulator [Clostridiales bacterium]|nr:helix-turn-helix transcriptional regulator [Clostridiales bacterium]